MEAISPTLVNLIIFVLAIYVGYHVVWNVTPALHIMKHPRRRRCDISSIHRHSAPLFNVPQRNPSFG